MTENNENIADRKALEASAHQRIDELLYAEALAGKYLSLLTLISGAMQATLRNEGNGMTPEEMRAYVEGIEAQIKSAPKQIAQSAVYMLLSAQMGGL